MKNQSLNFLLLFIFLSSGCHRNKTNTASIEFYCGPNGAPPIITVPPVTKPVKCVDGELLTWQQGSVTRYACLNYPSQALKEDHKWPLVIYLHGSITTPHSLYNLGKRFFDMRDTTILSDNDSIKGFILLAPEGRHAQPYKGNGPETGNGFHWDEWYRNPSENLDALAIDHFLNEVINTGKVDLNRIYVFGWSNGAFMTVLYSSWRSGRIAAMAQYAGSNPWSRTPCPVAMSYNRQVPLFLLRNLCDALVPCDATNAWIDTLESKKWPFQYYSLNSAGDTVSNATPCDASCSKLKGDADHIRWPKNIPLELMLDFFKNHPLKAR